MPISTRDLSALADPTTLEKLTQSIAMLEAIVSPEWEYRYFSFNRRWDESKGERMASMRNGSGDEYFLVFSPSGAFLKGFDHESIMSPWTKEPRAVWPGVLDHVPAQFAHSVAEPAFSMGDTTFCIWRISSDQTWQRGLVSFPDGDDPDGSRSLLWMLDGLPETYVRFASDYYEAALNLDLVRKIYEFTPLDSTMILEINPGAEADGVFVNAAEIGYPVAQNS
jgi:hypothetical protein